MPRWAIVAIGIAGMTWGCSREPVPPAGSGHGGHAAGAAGRTALLGNLGSYQRPITASAEAQRFFDEGLTLLYGFNHEEAFRSFAQAAALDPKAPMPHWGMALALGTNYNDTATPDRLQQAHAHLRAAEQRAANGSEVERAFVAALARRYVGGPADGRQSEREAAYAAAMGEVAARYPDDPDAATLHAESLMNLRPWKLYAADGTPAPGTPLIVATLEAVLTKHPDHPGANHYLIHAVEASSMPERAAASAKRLETLVPGAGHLVHMPAHIWMRTGDYNAAVRANAAAAEVDEQYVKATGATGLYPMMYYGHNLQFESAAAMMAGNLAKARAAGRKTATLVAPMAGEMAMLQPFALQELLALVRFGLWDEVLAAPAPPATHLLQTALAHYARGAAHAGKGQAAEAAKELAAFEAAAATIGDDVMYSGVNAAPAVLSVARADLTARVAQARREASAIAAWRRAVAAEDVLAYNEPPDWLFPAREALADALARQGDWRGAEAAYRAELARHPRNPRALFGLWKVLERQNRTADAAAAAREFEAAWAEADVTLADPTRGSETGHR